jgi:hypothetical protein
MHTYTPPPIRLSKKRQLIDAAGFQLNLDCALYVHRRLKKAFSWQYLDAHTADDVAACLNEPATGHWQFYFNEPPGPGKRALLEAALS